MGQPGASQAANRALCKGRSGFREGEQAARAARMTELAQRLRLDLADALARDPEARPDLLERVVSALPDAKAQPQHLLLARRERGQHLPRLIWRCTAITASAGESAVMSSMKSPTTEASSSPTGVP